MRKKMLDYLDRVDSIRDPHVVHGDTVVKARTPAGEEVEVTLRENSLPVHSRLPGSASGLSGKIMRFCKASIVITALALKVDGVAGQETVTLRADSAWSIGTAFMEIAVEPLQSDDRPTAPMTASGSFCLTEPGFFIFYFHGAGAAILLYAPPGVTPTTDGDLDNMQTITSLQTPEDRRDEGSVESENVSLPRGCYLLTVVASRYGMAQLDFRE